MFFNKTEEEKMSYFAFKKHDPGDANIFEIVAMASIDRKKRKKIQEMLTERDARLAIADTKNVAINRLVALGKRVKHHIDPQAAKKANKPLIKKLIHITKSMGSKELITLVDKIMKLTEKNRKLSQKIYKGYKKLSYREESKIQKELNSNFRVINDLLCKIQEMQFNGPSKKEIICLLFRIATSYRSLKWRQRGDYMDKMHSYWQKELGQPIKIFQLYEPGEECPDKPSGFLYYFWCMCRDWLYIRYPESEEDKKERALCLGCLLVILIPIAMLAGLIGLIYLINNASVW